MKNYSKLKNSDIKIRPSSSLRIGKSQFRWETRTYIMGILNVTPDSFSGDGTMHNNQDWVSTSVDQALQMEDDGAHIIDVGGESTRPPSVYPNAAPIHADLEVKRVIPVIEKLVSRLDIPISIDTRKATVAQAAISAGAHIINDVSMLADPDMAITAAKHDVPVVISHNRDKPIYVDVAKDVAADLTRAVNHAIDSGIEAAKIIIDPGIGFAKNAEQSLIALKNLKQIKAELNNLPTLIGVSRKSFIGAILDAPPQNRIEGNAAANVISIANGADIIRVHEVREMSKAAKVADAILRA